MAVQVLPLAGSCYFIETQSSVTQANEITTVLYTNPYYEIFFTTY